jgi:uncharacterized protein
MIQKDFSGHSLIALTDSEVNELEDFFLSDDLPEGTMTLETIDGFLTALVLGRVFYFPVSWVPLVWDFTGGGKEPKFESVQQAKRIMEMLMKMMSSIDVLLTKHPHSYMPLPDIYAYESDEERVSSLKLWATGFLIGVSLNEAEWEPVFSDETATTLFSVIHALSVSPDDSVQLSKKMFREFWERVPDCVRGIKVFLSMSRQGERDSVNEMEIASGTSRTGRNEPCQCGSGKKFKKCCGR